MRTVAIAVTIAATFLLSAAPTAAEPIKFARYPHASHGKLVFSYHGDIWVANEDGSNPVRLTAHVARDTFPRISPDGRWVAFSSDRFGNDDVFVIPITGGEPRQLTFNTTGDTVLNWMPDGKGILMATSRAVSPWRSPAPRGPRRRRPADAAAHGWGRAGHDEAGRVDGGLQPQREAATGARATAAIEPTTSGCRTFPRRPSRA